MRTKRVFPLLVGVALAFSLSCHEAVAQTQGQTAGTQGQYGKAGMPCLQGLNLTSDQLAKINALHEKYYKETSEDRVSLMEKREQLTLLLYNEKWKQGKIDEKVDEIAQLRGNLTKEELNLAHEIRDVLTPDQRALWDASNGRFGMGVARGFCRLGGMGMLGEGAMKGCGRGMGRMGGGMRGWGGGAGRMGCPCPYAGSGPTGGSGTE